MKTAPAPDPGGDDRSHRRRYIPLTADSFSKPDEFAWKVAGPHDPVGALELTKDADGSLVPVGEVDHSAPFLHANRVEDLRAALSAIEREGRLYADSGVDLAMVVGGQVLIAQAKNSHHLIVRLPRRRHAGFRAHPGLLAAG